MMYDFIFTLRGVPGEERISVEASSKQIALSIGGLRAEALNPGRKIGSSKAIPAKERLEREARANRLSAAMQEYPERFAPSVGGTR